MTQEQTTSQTTSEELVTAKERLDALRVKELRLRGELEIVTANREVAEKQLELLAAQVGERIPDGTQRETFQRLMQTLGIERSQQRSEPAESQFEIGEVSDLKFPNLSNISDQFPYLSNNQKSIIDFLGRKNRSVVIRWINFELMISSERDIEFLLQENIVNSVERRSGIRMPFHLEFFLVPLSIYRSPEPLEQKIIEFIGVKGSSDARAVRREIFTQLLPDELGRTPTVEMAENMLNRMAIDGFIVKKSPWAGRTLFTIPADHPALNFLPKRQMQLMVEPKG